MKKLFEQSAEKVRAEVRLLPHEKVQMKELLVAHMEKNPLRGGKKTAWYAPFTFLFSKPVVGLALCITLVTGVSTSYAAESALPGDVLYPVKVNVNENVHALVLFSDESKAQWELERANRRIVELQALEKRGQVSEELHSQMEDRYTFFQNRAEERLKKLQLQGKTEAATQVQQRLDFAEKKHEDLQENFVKKTLRREERKEKLEEKEPRAEVHRSDDRIEKRAGNDKRRESLRSEKR